MWVNLSHWTTLEGRKRLVTLKTLTKLTRAMKVTVARVTSSIRRVMSAAAAPWGEDPPWWSCLQVGAPEMQLSWIVTQAGFMSGSALPSSRLRRVSRDSIHLLYPRRRAPLSGLRQEPLPTVRQLGSLINIPSCRAPPSSLPVFSREVNPGDHMISCFLEGMKRCVGLQINYDTT